MTEHEKQASRLIHKYGHDGALKAARRNGKNAKSEAQEEFWERVAERIEEACSRGVAKETT